MKTIKFAHALALFVAPFSLIAGGATAFADATANIAVSATVAASCTISAGALAFGAYNTIGGAAVNGTATLTVACAVDGVPRSITLGQGANPEGTSSADAPLRQMGFGTERLKYQLYSGGVGTTVWGGTTASDLEYTATSSAGTPITVYGTIGAAQDVDVGAYTDSVVATITF